MKKETKVMREIAKAKKNLIAKAKKTGLYENFGEKEHRALFDKFNVSAYGNSEERFIFNQIQQFENWCMNFDLSMI
jgi:hypothetical protein